LLGREVVLFGAVAEIRQNTTGPTKVMLARRQGEDFSVIFFDKEILAASKVEAAKGEYIRARGVVAKYKNKYTGRDEFQIVVTMPAQVEIEVLSPTAAVVTPPAAPVAAPGDVDAVAPAPVPESAPAPTLPSESPSELATPTAAPPP
jgi:hypothetical protein